VNFNQQIGVYVEQDGMVRFRPVVPGFLDGWKVRIPQGLNPGERVVVVGHRIVEDGEQVHVTKTIHDMGEIFQ
jgi:membrane fusion protein (multidrug efflux system)